MKAIHFPDGSSPPLIRLLPPTGKDFLSLQVGQVLKGEILEVMEDGHAVLRLGGYDVSVESRIPLQKNMEGTFQVTSLSPQIILKLLPTGGNRLEGIEKKIIFSLRTDPLMENLSKTLSALLTSGSVGPFHPLRETLEHLLKLWATFSPSSSFQFEPEQIAKMILQSGLFFENRLRRMIEPDNSKILKEVVHGDLKGILLKLKAEIKAFDSLPEPAPTLKEVQEGIDLLLGKIESSQQLNSSYMEGMEEKFSLLLPLCVEGRFQFIDLLLSLSSQEPGPSQKKGVSMLFLLHFLEWGRMSIEVQLMGKRLYGQFYCALDEVASFLNRGLPDLQKALSQLGFQPEIHVSTRASEKILEQFIIEVKGDQRSLINFLV